MLGPRVKALGFPKMSPRGSAQGTTVREVSAGQSEKASDWGSASASATATDGAWATASD
jgi:hypothetical protein